MKFMFPVKSVKLSREYKKKENTLNPVVNLNLWNYSIEVSDGKVKAHTTSPRTTAPKKTLFSQRKFTATLLLLYFPM